MSFLTEIDVGILLNITGSVFVNLGNNLQSAGSQKNSERISLEETAPSIPEEKEEDEEVDLHHKDNEDDRNKLVNKSNENESKDSQDSHDQNGSTKQRNKVTPLMEGASIDLESKIKTIHVPDRKEIISIKNKINEKAHIKDLNDACDTWTAGTVLFTIGAIIVFVSYRFAPQSLLAPLGSIQFVSNVIFAREIHGSKITFSTILATLFILVGIILVVEHTPTPSTHFMTLDIEELQNLYTFQAYQFYLLGVLGVVIVCEGIYRLYRRAKDNGKPLYKDHIVRPLAYAFPSCAIGSQSTLQAKCLSEILFNKHIEVTLIHWFTYVIVLGFLCASAFWLIRMNHALGEFDAVFIIPVLQVCWIFFTTLNGGMYFREFTEESFLHHRLIGFIVGILVIFLGVALLSPNKPSEMIETMAVQAQDKINKEVIDKHKDKFKVFARSNSNDSKSSVELSQRNDPSSGSPLFSSRQPSIDSDFV